MKATGEKRFVSGEGEAADAGEREEDDGVGGELWLLIGLRLRASKGDGEGECTVVEATEL